MSAQKKSIKELLKNIETVKEVVEWWLNHSVGYDWESTEAMNRISELTKEA